MASVDQFKNLLYLTPDQFKHPENMDISVLTGLDRLILKVGSKPVIISDYRPGDTGQHGLGTAIDTVWPGIDPLGVWSLAKDSQFFSGLGVYVNDKNAVSFHFDTRIDRSRLNPALWGDFITYPFDPQKGEHVRKDDYVGADLVIDFVKKNVGGIARGAILLTIAIYLYWESRKT